MMSNARKKLSQLHEEGSVVIHCCHSPESFYDKLDDRRIQGNLREDGGPSLDQFRGYQLFPVISGTLLPNSSYFIRQELFAESLFVILDLSVSKFKGFFWADAHSYYEQNKKGRLSYKLGFNDPTLITGTPEERRKKLAQINRGLSEDATHSSFSDLFGYIPPSMGRAMNETLLKVNVDSLLGIGTTAAKIQKNTHIIFDLVEEQQKLYTHMGIYYPLYIYNNTKNIITLELKEMKTSTFTIGANQFFEIDVIQIIPQHTPAEKTFQCREKSRDRTQETLNLFTEILSPHKNDFVKIHKSNRPDAESIDKYEEIDQAALEEFIKKTHKDSKDNILLKKIYNLQFRLNIYVNLLLDPKSIINFTKLEQDLAWAEYLYKKFTGDQTISPSPETAELESKLPSENIEETSESELNLSSGTIEKAPETESNLPSGTALKPLPDEKDKPTSENKIYFSTDPDISNPTLNDSKENLVLEIPLLIEGLQEAKKATKDPKKKVIADYLVEKLDDLKNDLDNQNIFIDEAEDYFCNILLNAERAMSHHTNWFKIRSSSDETTAFSVAKKYFFEIRKSISPKVDLNFICKAKPSEFFEGCSYRFFAKHIKNNKFTPDFNEKFKQKYGPSKK